MTNQAASNTAVNNGVDVEALLGAKEALDATPEAAQFKWRASSQWVNGTHTTTKIDTFFGLGAEQSRGKTFTVDTDHPQIFAAEDKAPTPVELVLSGLAGCLTAGVATIAQNRGIQLNEVTATIEGGNSWVIEQKKEWLTAHLV